MDTRKMIAWNLRRIRVGKNISQEQLALEAMIDRAYVGRIERGMENVTVNTLDALAKALSVTAVEFFRKPVGEPPPLRLRAGRKPKR
ncbi:helix-turn-helix domain-containing protein [Aestuariivirga sp.]|uniref:helix-turn-helix domain-containing protein n=1 Tax=Aestuariivirga sp. TaxID=2650926 RepID=UPI0039E6C464